MIFQILQELLHSKCHPAVLYPLPQFPIWCLFLVGLQDRTIHHLLAGRVLGSLAYGFCIDSPLEDGVGRPWPFQVDWNLSLYHLGGRLCIAGAWTQGQ